MSSRREPGWYHPEGLRALNAIRAWHPDHAHVEKIIAAYLDPDRRATVLLDFLDLVHWLRTELHFGRLIGRQFRQGDLDVCEPSPVWWSDAEIDPIAGTANAHGTFLSGLRILRPEDLQDAAPSPSDTLESGIQADGPSTHLASATNSTATAGSGTARGRQPEETSDRSGFDIRKAPPAESLASDPPTPQAPYLTGMPGRPTSRHLLLRKMETRKAAGELASSWPEEAAYLAEWLLVEHPEAPPIKKDSIKRTLGDDYKRIKSQDKPTDKSAG